MSYESELRTLYEELWDGASGFGDPDAKEAHLKRIEYLQFKVSQRNQFIIALMAAVIGALVSALVAAAIH